MVDLSVDYHLAARTWLTFYAAGGRGGGGVSASSYAEERLAKFAYIALTQRF